MTGSFNQRLDEVQTRRNSLLCVGLDPDPRRLPDGLPGTTTAARVESFLRRVIEATAELVCAFKPQIAHFAALSAEGVLERITALIHEQVPGVPVLLDAKRGDIGSTAEHYAIEAFDRYRADAVTVNPYLGREGLEPFLSRADRGVIIVCRSSNAGADPVQNWPVDAPLYLRIAELAERDWNQHGNVMLVAGATRAADMTALRAKAPNLPYLVPGVGAQGGDLDAVLHCGLRADRRGLIVSSSRGIIYAGDASAAAIESAARRLRDAINEGRQAAIRDQG